MDDQKLENLLSLSLDATAGERERSLELGVGVLQTSGQKTAPVAEGEEASAPKGDTAEGTVDTNSQETESVWELIVKYSGDFTRAEALTEHTAYLLNEYAIVWIRRSRIAEFADLPEIEYIEKPKRLFTAKRKEADYGIDDEGWQPVREQLHVAQTQGDNSYAAAASCLFSLRREPLSLTGAGVLVAVVDSGVDIFNMDFRNPDGTTRILALLDETAEPADNEEIRMRMENQAVSVQNEAANRANVSSTQSETAEDDESGGEKQSGQRVYGRIYEEDEINRILQSGGQNGSYHLPGMINAPGEDRSGHGTAVLGIAAGNGANSQGRYRGVAPDAGILAVKLGAADPSGFPRTTQLMAGVNFVVEKALELQMPVAVNISFGNSYGPHDGTSLLERFLDDLSNYWKNVIVVGTGNEGAAAGHTEIVFTPNDAVMNRQTVTRLAIGAYEPTLNVQIWKNYVDDIGISIVHPSGSSYQLPVRQPGTHRVQLGETELLIFIGEPGPYSVDQEIFIDFLPISDYVDSGQWEIHLFAERIVSGRVDFWLPGGQVLGADTRFLEPSPNLTLTVPSTADRVLTVGAYDSRRDTAADFSGRGADSCGDLFTSGSSYSASAATGSSAGNTASGEVRSVPRRVYEKPYLAAPGENIIAPTPGNGYAAFSGTSVAAPFVTGSAALLMQWGIVEGNDPYLYGEKIKAYLQKGARQLPFADAYPNPMIGYGALCAADSLPGR